MIMRNCPNGFHFAQNISDVKPMSDAISDSVLSPLKRINDINIVSIEPIHNNNSFFVK